MHSVQHLQCNVRQKANRNGRFDYTESELNDFVQQQTLAAIDQVFAELKADPNNLLEISDIPVEQLTLTLAEPVCKDRPERFQDQIRQQLQQQLRLAIAPYLTGSAFQENVLKQAVEQLQAVIDSRNASAFAGRWDSFATLLHPSDQHQRRAARRWLLQQMQTTEVCAFLAQVCEGARLNALIRFLEPDQADFILSVIAQGTQLPVQTRQEKPPEKQPDTEDRTEHIPRPQLVKFTLTFLSAQRGSKFNRKSYLRSVLRDIAAHDNLSVAVLTSRLHQLAEQTTMPSELRKELLEITEAEEAPVTAVFSPESRTLLLDYEQALSLLRSGQSLSDAQWSRLLSDYVAIDSSLLDSFLTRLFYNETAIERIPEAHREMILHWANRQYSHQKWSSRVRVTNREDLSLSLREFAKAIAAEPSSIAQALNQTLDLKHLKTIRQLLRTQPRQLRALLLNAGNAQDILQALVCYLNTVELYDIGQILSPAFMAEFDHYAPSLKRGAFSLPGVSIVLAEQAYWQTCLRFTYRSARQPTLSFSLADVLVELVHQIRWQSRTIFSQSEADVLNGFSQLSETKGEAATDLIKAANQLMLKEKPIPILTDEARQWLGAVEQALYSGRAVQTLRDPVMIPVSRARLLKQPLLSSLRASLIRERFLSLPERIQTELLSSLIPNGGEPILVLWQQDFSEPLSRPSPPKKERFEAHQLVHRIQLFCLSYLAYDRGSQFNQHSFGRSLLRQISAHFNVSYQDFQEELRQRFIGTLVEKELCWLWAGESSLPENDEPESDTPSPVSPTLLDGIYREQTLKALLVGRVRGTATQWRQVIWQLQSGNRLIALSVFRYLQLHTQNLRWLIARSEGEEVWLGLLNFVLSMTGHVNSQDGECLLIAVKKFAQSSRHPAAYYWLVLEAVLSGQWLDLDALLSRSHKMALDRTLEPETASVSLQRPMDVLSRSAADQLLRRLLCSPEDFNYFLRWPMARQWQIIASAFPKIFHSLWSVLQRLKLALQAILSMSDQASAHRILMHELMVYCLASPVEQNWTRLIQSIIAQCRVFTDDVNQARLLQQLTEDQVLVCVVNTGDVSKSYEALRRIVTEMTDRDFLTDRTFEDNSEPVVPGPISHAWAGKTLTDFLNTAKVDLHEKQATSTDTWQPLANAGVVILSPYIPTLFERLGLLKGAQFVNDTAEYRAVSVLNYLCLGDTESLARLLGVGTLGNLFINHPPDELLPTEILTGEDKTLCDGLLQAVISHWQALGHTSLAGLRETFLQREAQIRWDADKGWLLRVEKRPFDVLLKRLPWGISTVKHHFMNHCIHVEW